MAFKTHNKVDSDSPYNDKYFIDNGFLKSMNESYEYSYVMETEKWRVLMDNVIPKVNIKKDGRLLIRIITPKDLLEGIETKNKIRLKDKRKKCQLKL